MIIKTALAFILVLLSTNSFASVTVTDYLNRTITLDSPAKRIIALAPHIVENVYSAGAEHALVGVVSYSDYPEAAKSIKRIGGYSDYSIEAILAMKPDLILSWHSGNGNNILQWADKLNIPIYIDEPKKLLDIAKSIQDIGILAGTQRTSKSVASEITEKVNELKNQNVISPPLTVMYQVWNSPLQTINGKHIINDVIELCGGTNVFADSTAIAPKISVESVIERNPDVIIASGMDTARPEWLDDWQAWPMINAVKHDNLVFIPPDFIQRHSARLLVGASMLCNQLNTIHQQRAY